MDAVAGWFDAVQVKATPQSQAYNICPTQTVPVLVNHEQQRQLVDMRWGFIPQWYTAPNKGPLLINARGETLAEKPAFRAAAKARRCLIPASGFYEWQREGTQKLPWYFRPRKGDLMAFAGIWQVWQGADNQRLVTCAMVTTKAGDQMNAIHHREPVVVQKDDFGQWLGEKGHGAAILMRHAQQGFYETYRVGEAVNSGRTDEAGLIEPVNN